MPIQPSEETDPAPGEPAPVRRGQAIGRLLTPISVALTCGLVAALAELLITSRHLLKDMPLRLVADNICYLFISHAGLGLVVCTLACLLVLVATIFLRRSIGGFRPAPPALAGFLVGEAILLVWVVAYYRHVILPDGLVGIAWVVGAGGAAFILMAMLCSLLGRTVVGRGMTRLLKVTAGPAFLLFIVSLVLQWEGRHGIQPADRFWPITAPSAPRTPDNSPPNVVLVVFDALRADRLGCYGYGRPTSPHLDAFASDAVVFEKAVSPGVWTVPSHASMFTGLYVTQHGARFGFDRLWLDDRFVTLAELLRERGYQTMALSNNPIVSPVTNLTRGFERFQIPREMDSSVRMVMLYSYVRFFGRFTSLASVVGPWLIEDPGGRTTTRLASRWLAQRDRSRPAFLFINYMETHDPYQPPLAYRREFVRSEDLPRSYWTGLDDDSLRWRYALAGKPVFTPQDIRILSDLYDARLREADDRFADLMRALAAQVDLDNTVVIVVSDHGENLGDHGLVGHQFSVHDTVAHVPLIVRWPRALKPRRVDHLVQSFDVFPTVLAWTGTPMRQAARVGARSLALPLQPSTQPYVRQAFAEYLAWTGSELDMVRQSDPDFDPSPWQRSLRAMYEDRLKLVTRANRADTLFELYNLGKDPGEKRNLAEGDRQTVGRLAQDLTRWVGTLKAFDSSHFSRPRDRQIEEEQHRRLRDLQYVQ
jgi:arylsulfatase A-like enzyme